MRRTFLWPDDLWIIVFLSEKHPETTIGGSVADHIYIRPDSPGQFKDLDILVGKSFWDMICETNKLAKEVMESGKFDVTNFSEMGIWSPGRSHILFGEKKYPAKFMISVGGVLIDAFVSKTSPPHQSVDYGGHSINIMKLEDRLASLDSIIAAKAKKEKMQNVIERREMILNLLGKK